MSWDYGWNAQSALMPEKTVQIKVGDKGNQRIKAAMLQIKENKFNQTSISNSHMGQNLKSTNQIKINKGVKERMRKDQQVHALKNIKDSKSFQMIRQQLQKKKKFYDQSEKNPKNHSLFLVDFVQKQLSKQDKELEQLKNQFYEGRLQQIIQQQHRIHQGEQKGIQQYFRENLAWQKQVLQELNGQFFQVKSKVSQSFDRKLSQQQKKALQRVIQQRLKQKQRIQQMKKHRQDQQMQRTRKLRKLDILDDSDEQK